MGMTITEKILAAHANLDEVKPGQLINVKVDIAMGNDVTAPIAIKEFKKVGAKKVFDQAKVVFVADHFTPNKDIAAAIQCKNIRDFAKEQNLVNYFEGGISGIEHALLPEQGLVVSGDLVIGADSHTCTYGGISAFATGVGSTDLAAAMITGEIWLKVPETIRFVYRGKLKKWVGGKDLILYTIGKIGVDGALYKAMEFTGETISDLEISGRLTMANMAIEAGAKNGIFLPDAKTYEYMKQRAKRKPTYYDSDSDAVFSDIIEFDVSDLDPVVACPHLPENVKDVRELSHVKIDQVVIGSCTNGRIEDLREAAEILDGRKVASDVRFIIIPATPEIVKQALSEGLLQIFLEAGAIVGPPTCGPCLGGHMGVLAEGEVAIATTNRNVVGRMGHPKSKVYLSNPAVAAASGITGYITHPDEVI
ncbi:MAG: 3-isopropylmalate dehydratase large subunit [Deltaproteobacteria bacterium]|nr:MAG: 3-isopropylmalate dehydratase large subunit [Deltaproteobacteria bacterium]